MTPSKHPKSDSLIPLDRDLSVPNRLNTRVIKRSIRNNLVSSNPGKYLCPEAPVDTTKDQNTNTNDREHVVWVSIGVPVTVGWDKRHQGEEDVGEEVDYGYGEICVPR